MQSFDSRAKTCVSVVFSKTKFLSVSVRNSSKDLSTSVTSPLRLGPCNFCEKGVKHFCYICLISRIYPIIFHLINNGFVGLTRGQFIDCFPCFPLIPTTIFEGIFIISFLRAINFPVHLILNYSKLVPNKWLFCLNSLSFEAVSEIHPLFQNSRFSMGFRISCPFGLNRCVLFTHIQE